MIMKCPDCEANLKQLIGRWLIAYHKNEKIKLKGYTCENKNCDPAGQIWSKSLETGEAVNPPLMGEILNKLERYQNISARS
jgi:hypothetical protein